MFSVYKLALLIMFEKIDSTHYITTVQCNMRNRVLVAKKMFVLIPTRNLCLKNYYFIREISFIWPHEIRKLIKRHRKLI